jgi:hypothetical protein
MMNDLSSPEPVRTSAAAARCPWPEEATVISIRRQQEAPTVINGGHWYFIDRIANEPTSILLEAIYGLSLRVLVGSPGNTSTIFSTAIKSC